MMVKRSLAERSLVSWEHFSDSFHNLSESDKLPDRWIIPLDTIEGNLW